MVLAYHLIFSTYGFWLPNDPRGSWSDFVASWELLLNGRATKTNKRRSVAGTAHNYGRRMAAKAALKRPPVILTGRQAHAAAQGFAEYANKYDVTIHACSLLPQHVHMVIARHRLPIEVLSSHLKNYATRALRAEGILPFQDRSCWSRGQWKVFLDHSGDIHRAIDYVEHNPIKEGLKPQRWSFVVPPASV